MNQGQSANTSARGESNPFEGISQFVAKVLDQLSLAAWLPAAMLVGAGSILLQLHSRRDVNVAAALIQLTEEPFGIAIVLLFAVVLASVIMQAFSYEVIRLLEGYWGMTFVSRVLLRPGVAIQVRRLDRLQRRVAKEHRAAFDTALAALLADASINKVHLKILRSSIHRVGESRPRRVKASDLAAAAAIQWRQHSSPALLRAYERSLSLLRDYPDPHRLLPTRLGNVLRRTEDDIVQSGVPAEELENLVLQRYETTSSYLTTQHDQFRNRLDMYCTLVPTFLFLSLTGFALLADYEHWKGAVSIGIAFAVLTAVSYRAAVASARGYGSVLRAIASAQS